MKRGGFKRGLGTGEFIRRCLGEKGPSYVQELWRAFKRWCGERGYSAPSYDSFRSYVWYLKELRLIERDREEESGFGESRVYYRLNPERVDHPAWRNPKKFCDTKRFRLTRELK